MLPNEPRPVRLMNTIWADRSGLHDDLTTTDGLTTWLGGTPVTADDLDAFRTLRQALRDLAATLTNDTRPIATTHNETATHDRTAAHNGTATHNRIAAHDRAVATINAAARRATTWPQLELQDGELHRRATTDAPPATATLAATAAEAVEMFTGPDRTLLRACYAPGCVLYFVKDHPRREWCSPACGNRVRAARHYRRTRTGE